jgi:hypothetical protein
MKKEELLDRNPYPHPYGLRNPYRNLKSENSQDYAKKPHQNCTMYIHTFGFCNYGLAAIFRLEVEDRGSTLQVASLLILLG